MLNTLHFSHRNKGHGDMKNKMIPCFMKFGGKKTISRVKIPKKEYVGYKSNYKRLCGKCKLVDICRKNKVVLTGNKVKRNIFN